MDIQENNMNAKKLAERLKASGITVQKIDEPCYEEDGAITISGKVHVQVPLEGDDPNVVRDTTSGVMIFYNPRSDFNELLADIRKAIAAEQLEVESTQPAQRL